MLPELRTAVPEWQLWQFGSSSHPTRPARPTSAPSRGLACGLALYFAAQALRIQAPAFDVGGESTEPPELRQVIELGRQRAVENQHGLAGKNCGNGIGHGSSPTQRSD